MTETKLEGAVGRRVHLPEDFADPVVIESMEDLGDVVLLRVRTQRGEPKETTVEHERLAAALDREHRHQAQGSGLEVPVRDRCSHEPRRGRYRGGAMKRSPRSRIVREP